MTTSSVRNCVVALFVALLVGACSSSSGGGAKGTYATQVDAICKGLQAQVGTDLGTDPAKQATAIADAVGKISAVSKPKDDSEQADLFIAALNNVNLSLQDVDQARMVNDATRANTALVGAKANAAKAAKAAKAYGMTTCAQPV